MSYVSNYGNDLEFVCVCFDFPEFFELVDMCDGTFCGGGAVVWIEAVSSDLSDVVGVCNVVCVV